MDNNAIKVSGASSIGDLARMGGDVAGSMTNESLKNYGAGFLPDLARMGGSVVSLAIDGTPVLTGTSGTAYDGFTVTASGGTTPYTYALVGTWPTGISIDDSTGAVSGTPTEDGSFASLSVSVTDADSNTASLDTFTLVIAAAG